MGNVHVPTTPAINATTVIANDIGSLSSVDGESLTRDRKDIFDGFYYGSVGTPTSANLIRALVKLERAEFASLTPSCQSAITAVMLALVKPGDHILAVDTATYSTRWFLDRRLSSFGIQIDYYAPSAAEDISRYFRPNTKLVFMESPGSFTYEVQDVAAIASACRSIGAYSVLDNTWAACTFFKPFDHGVDVSVVSLSKNAGGPAGMALGAVFSNRRSIYASIASEIALCGLHVSAHTCASVLSAMSSMGARLEHQQRSAAAIIRFLQAQPEIETVFHPALEDHPGHTLWRAGFSGSNSLISVSFRDVFKQWIPSFLGALQLFGIWIWMGRSGESRQCLPRK